MIIKSPPAPLFQRGESTQKSLMRHYYMLGVPIKKPDAPEKEVGEEIGYNPVPIDGREGTNLPTAQ